MYFQKYVYLPYGFHERQFIPHLTKSGGGLLAVKMLKCVAFLFGCCRDFLYIC